jgi:[NiFe] hydrogenase diaphorase moiety large subunit
VPRRDFSRKIAFEDLATGGSVIVFGPERDIFQAVENFMEFFVDESCGRCVPCRVGNRLLLEKFRKIADGRATERDIREVEEWGKLIKASSRCGLGQTSPNPILTTLHGFPDLYRARLLKDVDFSPEFDFRKSLEVGCEAAGRKPAPAEGHHE